MQILYVVTSDQNRLQHNTCFWKKKNWGEIKIKMCLFGSSNGCIEKQKTSQQSEMYSKINKSFFKWAVWIFPRINADVSGSAENDSLTIGCRVALRHITSRWEVRWNTEDQESAFSLLPFQNQLRQEFITGHALLLNRKKRIN